MKELLEEKTLGKEIQRHLWHGTSVQYTPFGLMPLVSICAKGFNRNYSGSSAGKWLLILRRSLI